MWHYRYLSFFIVFQIVFSLAVFCHSAEIGEVKLNGYSYVSMAENPNADSPGIGWIPEGDFVKILAGPFAGTFGGIPAQWYQVEYKKKIGFILSHLLNLYKSSSGDEQKDIAKIKINGNGYINLRANSSIDSPIIGCISEGQIIKVQSDPVQGYVGDTTGSWYKVTYQGNIGFIWEELLEFYSVLPQIEGDASDAIAGDTTETETETEIASESNKKTESKDDEARKKKLAATVIEMIKNGQQVDFKHEADGKLTIVTGGKNDYDFGGGYHQP